MWKDDGRDRPLIPKAKPLTFQIKPPWGHVLVGCYRDKEVTTADAHDANPSPPKKKWDLLRYEEVQ